MWSFRLEKKNIPNSEMLQESQPCTVFAKMHQIVNILPHSLTLPLHIQHIVTALAQRLASKPRARGLLTLNISYYLLKTRISTCVAQP